MRIATGLIQKGAQAAREWTRALVNLSTCEKEQQEKNNTYTLREYIQ
jgi:hypothetical protein